MKELLKIEKRSSLLEKDKFLSEIEKKLSQLGYLHKRKELGDLITKVNLCTECDRPEYIFIAHYDTGKMMPFWISWLFKILGVNRQLLLLSIMFIWSRYFMPWFVSIQEVIATSLSTILGLSFFSILFPNPKNYDDNTSGVITLLYIAEYLKLKDINTVQFLFVDKEEKGLLGSLAQYKEMKKNGELLSKPKVISIDCVGGKGETPLIVRNSKSSYEKPHRLSIEKEFGSCKSIRTLLPLSDNFSFRKLGAINISFVSKSLIPGGFFINGIHSYKDKEINIDRIKRLANLLVDEIDSKRG